jgi:glyoxylase-like metal-dependent hydrolase (beta-lactamase superfamily II)
MQLTDRVHLVASGSSGFDLTDSWDAHAYLLDGGETAALVDAGLGRGVDPLLENVAAAGVDPARLGLLLVTHAHPDHCGAAAALSRRLPRLRVAASPEVAGWLARADADAMSVEAGKRSEFYPEDFTPEPCPKATALPDGATLQVGTLTVRAIATPGHAAGHISYLTDDGATRILFGGDLLFHGGGISLLNTWDCDLNAYVSSLTRFRGAEIDALLPGHHSLSVRHGQRHLDAAIRRLDGGFIPPSIV